MNTLPYKVIDSISGHTKHEGRIGFDAAALVRPGSILSVPEGRYIVLQTEIDLNGPEAYLTVYTYMNKFMLMNPASPPTLRVVND